MTGYSEGVEGVWQCRHCYLLGRNVRLRKCLESDIFPKRPPPISAGVMVPSRDHLLPLGYYSTTTDYGLSFLYSVHPNSDSPTAGWLVEDMKVLYRAEWKM